MATFCQTIESVCWTTVFTEINFSPRILNFVHHCRRIPKIEIEDFFSEIPCIKAMDDIWVVMTPFGDVVTVILVANSYVVDFVD